MDALSKILEMSKALGSETKEQVQHLMNKFKYKYEEDLKYDSFVKQVRKDDPVIREIQRQKIKEFEVFFLSLIHI